ncbi:hypothetical protein KAT80_01950 [Candidatus Pacearchaeota archaeon]|nr:hypothetical protein [Candidatus Pacearchaeota archaeon]
MKWPQLIKIFDACKKENETKECKGCLLHELYGKWQEIHITYNFGEELCTHEETACFLIAHKNEESSHKLKYIKELVLPMNY